MIACALYEEFWLKYVEWLEGLLAKAKSDEEKQDGAKAEDKADDDDKADDETTGPKTEQEVEEKRREILEKIRGVFVRACVHHLPSKIGIHLAWSAFEERQGDIDKASEILQKVER